MPRGAHPGVLASYLQGAEPAVADKSAQPALGVPVQSADAAAAAAAAGYAPPAGYPPAAAGPSTLVVATAPGTQQVVPGTGATSDQVANAISKGGKLLQKGIKLAAAYSVLAIQKGTEYAIKNTAPADKPYEVNPQLQAR